MIEIPNNLTFVFDLGGVLIDWNPRHLYRKLFINDDEAMEFFLANVCSPSWNHKLDLGQPFAQAVSALVKKHPLQSDLIEAYNLRWEEMVSGAIDETVEVLRILSQFGYPLTALSNWSAETFPLMWQRFSFLSWFDTVVISGEVKRAKPDPEIFELFLDHIGREAGQCIFIDDSETNITVAEQLGFQTILFRSASELRDELVRFGLPGI